MKKISLFATGIFACALFSAHAQNTILYTTHDDWTNFNMSGSGLTFQATNTFDYDGVTVDGIGNASPGSISVGGSLQVSPIVPCNWGTNGPDFPGPGPTTGVLQAMDGPGAGYGSPVVAQSGTIYVEYTMPDHTNGTSFSMGIFFQDNVQWGGWSASADTDLGPVTTPYGTRELHLATIPYTLNATTNLSYAQIGFWIFTDYVGQNPWYIDNISIVPLSTPPTLPPVTPLFVTSNDFASFTSAGGDLVQADVWSVDGNTTNGLGNTTTPDAIGTSGSLLLYWSSIESGYGTIAGGPDEEANGPFMQAIDPGCDTNTEASAAAYGNIYLDYSQPDNSGGGNYFQVGIGLSYAANGYYGVFFPKTTTDLGVTDNNGYEVYRATIPYTINGQVLTTVTTTNNNVITTNTVWQQGYYYGFTPSIAVNSNYQPTNGFHVDNITVSAAQLPLITHLSYNGTNVVIQGTNTLGGLNYTLLSTTNLSLALTNWSVAGVEIFNGPMTFSNTFPTTTSKMFYILKVTQ